MLHVWSQPIEVEEFGRLHKCSVCGCVALAVRDTTPDESAHDMNNGLSCADIVVQQVMKDNQGWQAFDHLKWRW